MLGLFPFAKTFECAKISLVMISWSCLYIPLYNTSWLVVGRQLCWRLHHSPNPYTAAFAFSGQHKCFFFFSISHPNAGYTLKTTLSFFFWVCPPLNPPLVEVLFRRDTCIVLFPFKPKTLPFEDKIKMPLFSLQGYLKTLKSHFGGIPLEKIQCVHGLSFIPRWSPVCHTASF